jgi:hypothetical protein
MDAIQILARQCVLGERLVGSADGAGRRGSLPPRARPIANAGPIPGYRTRNIRLLAEPNANEFRVTDCSDAKTFPQVNVLNRFHELNRPPFSTACFTEPMFRPAHVRRTRRRGDQARRRCPAGIPPADYTAVHRDPQKFAVGQAQRASGLRPRVCLHDWSTSC